MMRLLARVRLMCLATHLRGPLRECRSFRQGSQIQATVLQQYRAITLMVVFQESRSGVEALISLPLERSAALVFLGEVVLVKVVLFPDPCIDLLVCHCNENLIPMQ